MMDKDDFKNYRGVDTVDIIESFILGLYQVNARIDRHDCVPKTAPRVAQLVRAQDCVIREVEGSSPGRTNTDGLKITEENLLQEMNRHSSLLVRTNKP